MPSSKKLASLRLDEETMERIDAVMARFYAQMGGVAPSRNAQLEAWVLEGLERMEARTKGVESK
ncbi:hypothetical protein [Deinococcus humi]|uniref:CopG family transcriptional regulator n=1 Tax=Deinococcus humi TaxID=662880 RepID=A0A7W8JTC7_9DEIO|nr:hypothetical protein [Deinococcus humi]MBB5361299.1 hypothetical protein [Deinococcus humi]GGO19372.1 hypothetical protein GCM10008949_03650 [Deinococcus humi]